MEWVLVPKEPTEAMIEAGAKAFLTDMRDRRLLKWLFAEEDNGPIGYVDGPIDLDAQKEGSSESVGKSFASMLSASPSPPDEAEGRELVRDLMEKLQSYFDRLAPNGMLSYESGVPFQLLKRRAADFIERRLATNPHS